MSRDRDLTSDPSAEHLADPERAQAELDAADARSGGNPDARAALAARRRARGRRRGHRQQRRLGRPRASLGSRSRPSRADVAQQLLAVGSLQDGDAVRSPGGLLLGPHRVVRRHGHAVREHVLAEGQLPDEDRPDVVAEPLRGAGVDLRVALPVVADEDPLDVRQLAARAGAAASPCASGPLRNQPLLVGPQSVSSSGPAGYRCRRRNRAIVGAAFQAPVDR